MPNYHVPTAKEIKDMMDGLLGRPSQVSLGHMLLATDLPECMVAAYTDDAGKLTAAVAMDLPLTAWVGAAIGLMPAGGAEDCIQVRELSPTLSENAREVLSVMISVLNRQGAPHQRLRTVYPVGAQVPQDVTARLLELGARTDLTVDIAGYGSGRLSISLAG